MEEESGRVMVDLFPAAKRSKSDLGIQETDFSKCIICQTKGGESLSKGSSTGIVRVIESCPVRKDDVFDRLQKEFNDLATSHLCGIRTAINAIQVNTTWDSLRKGT